MTKSQSPMKKDRLPLLLLTLCLGLSLFSAPLAQAQQTLGGITGTVMESTGSVLPGTVVNIVGDETKLTRTQTSSTTGSYDFVNLPIGSYTLTFTHEGFQTQKVPSIVVQANRTATVNATLQVGQVATTITVEETPLVNSSIPPTGTFWTRNKSKQFHCLPAVSRDSPFFCRGECGTAGWHRGQRRSGQPADLGQRPARHQQQLPAERRRRQQSV